MFTLVPSDLLCDQFKPLSKWNAIPLILVVTLAAFPSDPMGCLINGFFATQWTSSRLGSAVSRHSDRYPSAPMATVNVDDRAPIWHRGMAPLMNHQVGKGGDRIVVPRSRYISYQFTLGIQVPLIGP